MNYRETKEHQSIIIKSFLSILLPHIQQLCVICFAVGTDNRQLKTCKMFKLSSRLPCMQTMSTKKCWQILSYLVYTVDSFKDALGVKKTPKKTTCSSDYTRNEIK